MLPREDVIRCRHMLDAAGSAQRFTAGRRREDLGADEELRFATVRAIQIIGEAASQLSQQARDLLPAIPWEAIIAMRNRLVHARLDINLDIVWGTITEDLPPLIAQLAPLVPPEEPTAPS
jgi:uncharacterized protein with HEPN domain